MEFPKKFAQKNYRTISASEKRKSWTERTHLLKAEKSLFRSLRGPTDSTEETLSSSDSSGRMLNSSHISMVSDGGTASPSSTGKSKRTLGTFDGVFAPVSLSMLSSILFLRVGYIVGNAGILGTILLYAIAYVILVSTVFSICAISTNGAVQGGGAYFMISRTLGPEFGGSIGILFYFANIVSSALYLVACTEGLLANFGEDGSLFQVLPLGPWWNFGYSSLINALNLVVCLIGAKLFGKTSVFVLLIVGACTLITVISFFSPYGFEQTYENVTTCATDQENCTVTFINGTFAGFAASSLKRIGKLASANLQPKFERDCSDPNADVSFFKVFGVLFSGVTGIMAGANMSGELVCPGKNIPRGTLSACLFTLLTFLLLSFLTALTCDPELLFHDCSYMSDISLWPPSVAVGVLLATFSASLNNLMGASRVMEAVAKDILFGPFLAFVARGTVGDNPVAAVLVTWLFVEFFLLMGALNTIAQLCSVLFLLSYASINLACLGLDLASAPNFRPSFKYFSWHTSLTGLIGTTVMMFFVSPIFSAVSILLCLSLVLGLNFFSPIQHKNWGSISQALLFHQVRKYLLLLDPRKAHVKFWRPQMLLLVKNPRTSCSLIDFVNALKKGGLYVLGHVITSDFEHLEFDPVQSQQAHWLSLIDHLKVKAFVELTISKSLREGFRHLIRISGIGAMKPNTILIGFRESRPHRGDDFASPLSAFATISFEGIFPGPRSSKRDASVSVDDENNSNLSKEDFVGVILDVLKMQKNVCLCRHFQSLNKGALFRAVERATRFVPSPRGVPQPEEQSTKKLYLDVWLIDFFSPSETDISDTTSLFILQLACIVNSAPRWKQLSIRVYVAVKDTLSGSESEVDQSPASAIEDPRLRHPSKEEQELKHMLELLRIKATTHVLNWVQRTGPPGVGGRIGEHLTTAYLKSACETVRRRSTETAVSFLYLPAPPAYKADHAKYLDCLELLTDHWPPTLLIRGVSPVMSTTL